MAVQISEEERKAATITHKIVNFKDKNSIGDAHTPQPGEIVLNTMRYRSS